MTVFKTHEQRHGEIITKCCGKVWMVPYTCSSVFGIFWKAMTAARPSCDMSTAISLELVRCLKKTWMMRPRSSLRSGLSLHMCTHHLDGSSCMRACRHAHLVSQYYVLGPDAQSIGMLLQFTKNMAQSERWTFKQGMMKWHNCYTLTTSPDRKLAST